jgi:replicative DNA helicase
MDNPGPESRQQQISEISRGLKALGRELNVPVIALSQLNRQTEGRDGHRPRMSDLRESGSIEQDADVVILLHREDYYHSEADYLPDNVAEIIIAKQRNGPTGTVKLTFDTKTTTFKNLAAQIDF